MLDELTRKEELDCSLDLTGGDGGLLVVVSKTAAILSNRSLVMELRTLMALG